MATKTTKRKAAPLTPGRYVLLGCVCGKSHVAHVERSGRGFVAWGMPLRGLENVSLSRLTRDGWYLGRRLADRKPGKRKAGR